MAYSASLLRRVVLLSRDRELADLILNSGLVLATDEVLYLSLQLLSGLLPLVK